MTDPILPEGATPHPASARELVERARTLLDDRHDRRIHVLLDMVCIELAKHSERSPPGDGRPPDTA